MISPEQVEAVRQAVDIVDLVSGYGLNLKPSGRTYLALCPFHREKTPSFSVNPERQIFKCFGCQISGDVFSFVMAEENLSFPEAIRMLADRAGIRLDEARGDYHKDRLDRDHVAEALAFAANLYQHVLHGSNSGSSSSGEPGRKYLKTRGISPEMARAWGLGYAPQQRDFLHPRARKAGFSIEVLEAAGLCYPEKEGMPLSDRFTHRVMFPIHNTRDQVAGFGGRAISDTQKGKYINSSDGPLFHKSKLLYGLARVNQARRRNPELRQASVYVAEGYLDVMALHAAGIETAVAPLGTALTSDHVKLLRPAGTTVVLVFDGDRAGTEATRRAISELVKQDVEARVTRPRSGRDPYSIFQEDGAEALRAMVEDTASAYEFLLENALDIHGNSVEGRAAAAGELAMVLGQTPNAVKEDGYIRQAAFDLRSNETALRKVWQNQKSGKVNRIHGQVLEEAPAGRMTRETKAELDLALALIGQPELTPTAMARAPLKALRNMNVRKIVSTLYNLVEQGKPLETRSLTAYFQQEEDRDAYELVTNLIAEADVRIQMRAEGRIDRDRNPFEDLLHGYLGHLKRSEALEKRNLLKENIRKAMVDADDDALSGNLTAIADLDRNRYGTAPCSGNSMTEERHIESCLPEHAVVDSEKNETAGHFGKENNTVQ